MPEDDDTGSQRPREYHRKSDIEKYIAEPLLALAHAIERYVDTIAAERISQKEDQQRQESATESRHRESVAEGRWASKWGARISGLTLLVLVGTLYVYIRQANIMATQADIAVKSARPRVA